MHEAQDTIAGWLTSLLHASKPDIKGPDYIVIIRRPFTLFVKLIQRFLVFAQKPLN